MCVRVSFILSAILLLGLSWQAPARAQTSEDLKLFMRAVSNGSLEADDMGILSPFFTQVKPLGNYEDDDVFLALNENSEGDLVLFTWSKGRRALSLNEATERWAEERLAAVTTEDELAEWKKFRAQLRGPLLENLTGAEERAQAARPYYVIQAAAFVDTFAVIGEGDRNAEIQVEPMAYRFVKTKPETWEMAQGRVPFLTKSLLARLEPLQ